MAEENTGNETQSTRTVDLEKEEAQFLIQKIYVKDISFESPNAPDLFLEQQWNPTVDVNFSTRINTLGNDLYETTLKLTITAKLGEKTAYLVEVEHAAVFLITGFDEEQLHGTLGSYCPSILYPYTREVVSDLISKGGFPPYLLEPLNFDGLYKKQLEARVQREQEQAAGKTTQ